MAKDLGDMTPEELGQLFPIFLTAPNPEWKALYRVEEEKIRTVFDQKQLVAIDHIGSTSIPELISKPTIDILLQVDSQVDDQTIISLLKSLGFIFIPKPENPPPHMMFVKGYTPDGFKGPTFHVHVRYPGDWNEIYFRDYLLCHPETVRAYARLKEQLAVKFKNDRDGYTDAKTTFVEEVNLLARKNAKQEL